MRRTSVVSARALGTPAPLVATNAIGRPGAECFGKTATIQGAGTLTGTAGNDVIVGSAGDDTIDGQGGNDLICGLEGKDFISGGLGNDQIDAGPGEDDVIGDVFAATGDAVGGGNDQLFGGDDGDLLIGDSYALDWKRNGGGNDRIFGGNGDDPHINGDTPLSEGTRQVVETTTSRAARRRGDCRRLCGRRFRNGDGRRE